MRSASAARRRRRSISSASSGPRCLLPGSFNPVHEGHRRMLAAAAARLGAGAGAAAGAAFELAIVNPDKPPLSPEDAAARLAGFAGDETVWLTRAPTFPEKARIFPGGTFAVGVDTIARIAEPRYYGGPEGLARAIALLGRCRFLVFGRRAGTGVRDPRSRQPSPRRSAPFATAFPKRSSGPTSRPPSFAGPGTTARTSGTGSSGTTFMAWRGCPQTNGTCSKPLTSRKPAKPPTGSGLVRLVPDNWFLIPYNPHPYGSPSGDGVRVVFRRGGAGRPRNGKPTLTPSPLRRVAACRRARRPVAWGEPCSPRETNCRVGSRKTPRTPS